MKRYIAVLFVCLASCVHAEPVVGIAPTSLTQAESLQAVVDRGDRLVYIPQGNYTLSETLRLRSNMVLYVEPGTVIEAAEGAFKDIRDCLITLENVDHVRIEATGSIFRMRKSDYRDPAKYADSEFRHALDIRGSRDVVVDGGTFADSGGDGIYLGPFVQPNKTRIPNERILVRDVTCDNNTRQGVSVLSCLDCLVEDSMLMRTAGKSPQAGIDIEPEVGDRVDMTVRRCQSVGNRGPGFMISFQHLRPTDPPSKIAFEDCTYANVPADQPTWRLTGIFNDLPATPTGFLKANLPKGTTIRWDTIEWVK